MRCTRREMGYIKSKTEACIPISRELTKEDYTLSNKTGWAKHDLHSERNEGLRIVLSDHLWSIQPKLPPADRQCFHA